MSEDLGPERMYTVTLQLAFDGHEGTYPLMLPFAEHNDERAIAFARELVANEWERETLQDIRLVMVARYDEHFFPHIIHSEQAATFAPKSIRNFYLV